MYINRTSKYWAKYSLTPKVLLSNSLENQWIGNFQEVQYGAMGDWDLVNPSLHIASLLTTAKHRYGPSNKSYSDVVPSSAVAPPGHGLFGGWEGSMKGRHLFIEKKVIETILDSEPVYSDFFSHSFSKAGAIPENDPVVENLLGCLAKDLQAGCPTGVGYGDYLISALVVHVNRRPLKIYGQGSAGKIGAEPRIAYLIDRIHSELATKIQLSELAKGCGISVPYLCRIFKDSTGYSPHQYILSQRIELVKRLLIDPEVSLADVSLSAGFNDQSQMTTTFRKLVGTTPSVFRKNLV